MWKSLYISTRCAVKARRRSIMVVNISDGIWLSGRSRNHHVNIRARLHERLNGNYSITFALNVYRNKYVDWNMRDAILIATSRFFLRLIGAKILNSVVVRGEVKFHFWKYFNNSISNKLRRMTVASHATSWWHSKIPSIRISSRLLLSTKQSKYFDWHFTKPSSR